MLSRVEVKMLIICREHLIAGLRLKSSVIIDALVYLTSCQGAWTVNRFNKVQQLASLTSSAKCILLLVLYEQQRFSVLSQLLLLDFALYPVCDISELNVDMELFFSSFFFLNGN